MKLVVLRGEDPPADAVVVVRGGLNGLAPETVARAASRSEKDFGFLGISVYLAIDEPVDALCRRLDQLRRYSQVRLSTVARIRAAGFALFATGDPPHFDIVLPDLSGDTIARLGTAFDDPQRNPGARA